MWFITGASRGFGRIWAEAALERGDSVAVTARSLKSIKPLKEKYGERALLLELDVTNPQQVHDAVNSAHQHFGRLDCVVNNAGYSLVGMIEEAKLGDIRALYETNILGAISVIQAALPLLRAQGYGHILGVSSGLGHTTLPLIGYYCSSKWAFEAIHESLALEVKEFGIKVTIVEPGAYATEFGSPQSFKAAESQDIYSQGRAQFMERMLGIERGDPSATPQAMFKLVDSENPPLRLILGSAILPWIRQNYADRISTWESWEAVSNSAQGEPVPHQSYQL